MNSWQLRSDERPSYSTICATELDNDSLWSLQLFHSRRPAHLTIHTYPTAHDLATHNDATRYSVELDALPVANGEIARLKEKLVELDREQVLFIKEYFKDEDWLQRAQSLQTVIETLPVLTPETLTNLKSSPHNFTHPILDALLTDLHNEASTRDRWEGFLAEIAEAEEELRFAKEEICSVEKRALRVWWKLDGVRGELWFKSKCGRADAGEMEGSDRLRRVMDGLLD